MIPRWIQRDGDRARPDPHGSRRVEEVLQDAFRFGGPSQAAGDFGGEVSLRIGPLKAGTYAFFDEFHEDQTKGTLVVK